MSPSFLICFMVAGSAAIACAAPTVRILASLPSPQAVGTVIGLTAMSDVAGTPLKAFEEGLVFRYSVSVDGGEFHVVRDFSPSWTFPWRPDLYEHEARVRVTVKDKTTKASAEAELPSA